MDSKQRIHVMTLANSIIGVSILAMPFCFKQCGIVLSIMLLLLSSILCRLACHFLLKSAIKSRLRTFEFLAYHVFGSVGKLFVEIGMIGFLLGTCVAFFVVIGDLSPQIIAQVTETKSMETLRTTILVALGLFCVLPLGLLRNVDSLSSVSIATILFYAILVLKIFLESAPQLFMGNWYEHVDFWRPSGILQCIPIFSMALFCQTQLFEIYQAIPNASLEKMNEVVKIAVNICTSVYIFVGVFGYIAVAHKPSFSGNILMDFEPSIITETMKLGFVLSVAFSFPLIIFPCRASLYSLLYRSTYTALHDASNLYIPEGKFRVLTFIIVLVSLIIGILIPNIELVLGLVGSTIGIMICVIFPATCFICLTQKNTNERVLAQIMLVIGIGVMVLGTYANLYAIDHIEPSQSYEKLSSNTVIVNVNIKDIPVNDNIPIKGIENLGEIKSLNNLDKEMQIKIPDAVREIRREPVQPEEPLEPAEHLPEKMAEEVKQQMVLSKIGQGEETLQEPVVNIEDAKKEQVGNKDKPKETEVINKSVVLAEKRGENELKERDDKEEIANLPEVDIEAIKKEDRELEKGNIKANVVMPKKLVEQKQNFAEENKKMLKELKVQQVNAEKLKAVQNIQTIAKEAIDAIVDDKVNDTKMVVKMKNEKVEKIKNIVKESEQKRKETEKVIEEEKEQEREKEKHEAGNANAKPLSYQLGLHEANINNQSLIGGKDIETKQIEKSIDQVNRGTDKVSIAQEIKIEPSVVDIIVGLPNNAEKKVVDGTEMKKDIEIMKKKFTEYLIRPNQASPEDAGKQEGEVRVKEKQEDKKEQHKNEENLEIRRDILSRDYVRKKRDVEDEREPENCTKPSELGKVKETRDF